MDLLCFFSVLCLLCLCASVYMCLVVTCWEWLTSWLSFVVSNCEFVTLPIGILGQMWYLIVWIPGFCTLTYFNPSLTCSDTINIRMHSF